ncbi:MAG: invasion associated locus B family protein [Magnetococcales bacterium]|nr:invasion associated locus B family protein [Magnetococcales bacterium]
MSIAVRSLVIGVVLSAFLVVMIPASTLDSAPRFTRSQAYGDWLLNCFEPASKSNKQQKESCVLRQQLTHQSGKRLILITIVQEQKKQVSVRLILPLGFDIPKGVKLQVDGGSSYPLQILSCHNVGCQAEAKMSSKMRRSFVRGKMMHVVMTSSGDNKTLKFPLSLRGISNGINSIK